MTKVNYSPAELLPLLESGEITLIDVREPNEYEAERIPGALLFPLSSFSPKNLPTNGKPIIFHCRSGKRSMTAINACASVSIGGGAHLEGGIEAWKAAGLPIIRG